MYVMLTKYEKNKCLSVMMMMMMKKIVL